MTVHLTYGLCKARIWQGGVSNQQLNALAPKYLGAVLKRDATSNCVNLAAIYAVVCFLMIR